MGIIRDASRKARQLNEEVLPLRAVFVNGTLKPSDKPSNTQALVDHVIDLMKDHDDKPICETITLADYDFDHSVSREKSSSNDQWPEIYSKLKEADIIVIACPIWFGQRSSYIQKFFERLIGSYGDTDDQGRYPLYNKVGGVIVTGNEDGAHNVVATTTGNMAHLGLLVPPNCDTYWVGDAGAGPSYIQAGQKHLYTNKLAEYMAHNLIYYGRLIQENPNPINMTELMDKAKSISDEPVEIEDPEEAERLRRDRDDS